MLRLKATTAGGAIIIAAVLAAIGMVCMTVAYFFHLPHELISFLKSVETGLGSVLLTIMRVWTPKGENK